VVSRYGEDLGIFCLHVRWVGPARGEIEMRLVQFTGTPVFSKDGTESMPKVLGAPRYVGPPSPEVDQAWDKLTFGEGNQH
jgi:hypothetical protein